jgi:fluoride ion exporter CrcB/FEX
MNLLLAGLGASLGAMLRYFFTNYGKSTGKRLAISIPIYLSQRFLLI